MEKLSRVIALFFFGAMCHLLAPLIDALPRGWGNLTRSAIGAIMLWFGGLQFSSEFRDVPNPQTRWTLRYFAGGIPVGVGVVFAYIVFHFISRQNDNE
jgi:hypothetical protein